MGVGLGTLLHQYIIHTIRVDMVMFGQHVSLVSFLISAVLTAVFSAFVNFVMYFKTERNQYGRVTEECGIEAGQKIMKMGLSPPHQLMRQLHFLRKTKCLLKHLETFVKKE